MIRIAVVGLGFMGKTHMGAYARIRDAVVHAGCDTDASIDLSAGPAGNIKTDGAVAETTIRRYTDFHQMLSDGGFDAVDICLPTHLHAQAAVEALKAGYHVLCEKPLALTVEETNGIVAAARASDRVAAVAHCLRFWPAYVEVERIIRDGRYGQVRAAELSRYTYVPHWSRGNWMLDSARSGGPVLDVHIHDTDLVLHLFGMPETVRSTGTVEGDGLISRIATQYGYRERIVTASGGWVLSDSFGFNMRAFFVLDRAVLDLDFSKEQVLTIYPHGAPKLAPALPAEDGYYFEIVDFMQAIRAGRAGERTVTPESAARSVGVCLAEIACVRSGHTVEL